MKRLSYLLLTVCLTLSLAACGSQAVSGSGTNSSWTFPDGPAPEREYERAFWYGFAPADRERSPETAITEREMVEILTQVLTAGGGDVEGWKEMTAGAAGEAIYRDYGAMLLLYAAERMDAASFTNGFAPYLMGGRTDEDWEAFGTDIRGGYPLFEEGENRWDQVCTSISAQMGEDLNYLNASQNYAISRLSLITGAPLLDFFVMKTFPQKGITTQPAQRAG